MSKQVWEPIHLTWILKWFTPCRVIQINHTTRPQHRSLSLVLVLITSCKKQLFSSWGRHVYHVHILNLICEQANVGSMDWTRLKEELKLTEMSPRATKIILLHFEGANCHCINPTESQNHAPSDGPPWDPISNVYSNEWRATNSLIVWCRLNCDMNYTHDVSQFQIWMKTAISWLKKIMSWSKLHFSQKKEMKANKAHYVCDFCISQQGILYSGLCNILTYYYCHMRVISA